MSSSRNKIGTVIFFLLLSPTFTTLAISSRSGRFAGIVGVREDLSSGDFPPTSGGGSVTFRRLAGEIPESDSENRSRGSGNWAAVSGGRPGQSDPSTLHHHKSCTENCDSKKVVVPDPRPVRSGPNPFHHNDNPTASQP